MEQSSQMLQYFDQLPTFNFNNAKIMQNLSKSFFDLALFCKIRLKWKVYVNYAKFCIEVYPDESGAISGAKNEQHEVQDHPQVHSVRLDLCFE